MGSLLRAGALAFAFTPLAAWAAARPPAPGMIPVSATTHAAAALWDDEIERMVRAGELALRRTRTDTLLPGRTHTRFRQIHRGVPVRGGEIVRQEEAGQTVSVFGSLYAGVDVDPTPSVSPRDALAAVEQAAGVSLGEPRLPELAIAEIRGAYRLVYPVRAFTGDDLVLFDVDARTGSIAHSRSDARRQSAVGLGTGVLSDTKKMSVSSGRGAFITDDALRPPSLITFDLKGDLVRTINFLNGVVGLGIDDLAFDSDNVWTDGPAVDAHTYAGWTYDYYYRRFGRRGLDDRDLELLSIVHPVRREDLPRYSEAIRNLFYLNAFYAGQGLMIYGEGYPPEMLVQGQRFDYFAGALDVVAHELTHGVTEYSSDLAYENESGALNESFSDMMSAGAEFFFQPAGDGPLKADYLLGEDVITPGGVRSMADPGLHGDPDHYSRRFLGAGDNGGVHINSGIPNHAFYLAIEGGTNRTSGLAVQGVGAARRDEIEKVMYRTFVYLLPPRADFALARRASLQSARDLYGEGSAAERAVGQAWDAVGVQ